jgi:hypothetical protein
MSTSKVAQEAYPRVGANPLEEEASQATCWGRLGATPGWRRLLICTSPGRTQWARAIRPEGPSCLA